MQRARRAAAAAALAQACVWSAAWARSRRARASARSVLWAGSKISLGRRSVLLAAASHVPMARLARAAAALRRVIAVRAAPGRTSAPAFASRAPRAVSRRRQTLMTARIARVVSTSPAAARPFAFCTARASRARACPCSPTPRQTGSAHRAAWGASATPATPTAAARVRQIRTSWPRASLSASARYRACLAATCGIRAI